MPDPELTPALRANRERTIALLAEHFARDHLEAEELERLIDRAYAAASQAELDALLAPLPALPTRADAVQARPSVPDQARRPKQFVVAVMGGTERKGRWVPARAVNVVALMGGIDLDFRSADLPPGVTEVRVLAVMGGVDILVPPGVVVQSDGIGIMGGFGHAGEEKYPTDESVPILRITGLAFMGGVDVRVRLPGETGRDARRRLRQERRRLREGGE